MDWPVGKIREPRFLELGPFPPLVANHLSLQTYANGEGVMIGDIVTVNRRLLPSVTGVVVGLQNVREPGRKWGDRLRITGAAVRATGKDRYYRRSRIHLARRPTEYRAYWRAWYEEQIGDWRALAASDPLLPTYDPGSSQRNEVTIVDFLSSFDDGRDIACSGLDDGLAAAFFRRAIVQADHLLEKTRKEPLPAGAAQVAHAVRRDNELEIRRKCAYAAALLGEPLDQDSLRKSALHWASICADVPRGYWDDQHKLKLLRAVMWDAIAGEFGHARELLATKRSFTHHEDHLQLLRKLVRKTVPPHTDGELVDRCRAFFDLLRHPRVAENRETWYARETAFEWAVLMTNFIDRPGEEIDWRAVIDAVSR